MLLAQILPNLILTVDKQESASKRHHIGTSSQMSAPRFNSEAIVYAVHQ